MCVCTFFKIRRRGAVLIDNLKIDNIVEIFTDLSELIALNFEFKLSLNKYLKELVASPVKSLADVIAFNKKHPKSVGILYIRTMLFFTTSLLHDCKNQLITFDCYYLCHAYLLHKVQL